jgi:hypothetical protein
MEIFIITDPFFIRVPETASMHESEGSPEEYEKTSSEERCTMLKNGGPALTTGP